MRKRTYISIGVFVLAILAFGVAMFLPNIINIKENFLVFEKNKTTNIPQGKFLFNVVSNEGDVVKFVEGDINPPDVHVGDLQKFRLVVESPKGVQEVIAYIETDNNTFSLPLKRERVATTDDLLPFQYAIQNGALIEVSRLNQKTQDFGDGSLVPKAIAEEIPTKEVWIGEWTVEDTHDAIYHTTFVAMDSAQNKAEIVVAWSDACAIPLGGDWNLASYGNCTISSLDGVDNGNITISTYTLTLNNKFVFNSGKTISIINGGQVVVGVGGGFEKANLYMSDADTDGYPSSISQSTSSLIAGARRRYQLTSYNADCDDASASVYTGTVSSQGCTVTNECSNTCAGTQTRTCQSNGTFTAFSACGGCTPTACCTAVNYYRDLDGDGDGAGTVQGSACPVSIPNGYVSNNNDCDDTNISIKSGSTRTRYQSSTPVCGTACASETQTCQAGGTWSGTYSGTSCTASTQIRYGALTSACGTYGSTSETQTCQTNGTWSPNNYSLTSAPSPTTRTMYISSAPCDTACSSQAQTCQSNGTWSPNNYLYASCTPQTSTEWWIDFDHDNYGNNTNTQWACSAPSGYISGGGTVDCNDMDGSKFRTVAGYRDGDYDGYGYGSYQTCVGDWVSYVANNSDCYDSNYNARPGQTQCFSSHRGDGSFDYNCDGSTSLMYNHPVIGCTAFGGLAWRAELRTQTDGGTCVANSSSCPTGANYSLGYWKSGGSCVCSPSTVCYAGYPTGQWAWPVSAYGSGDCGTQSAVYENSGPGGMWRNDPTCSPSNETTGGYGGPTTPVSLICR